MISTEELLSFQNNVKSSGFAALMSEAEKRTKAKSHAIATINNITTVLSCVHDCMHASPALENNDIDRRTILTKSNLTYHRSNFERKHA